MAESLQRHHMISYAFEICAFTVSPTYCFAEMKLSFWRTFHHWMYRKFSFRQLSMQPVTEWNFMKNQNISVLVLASYSVICPLMAQHCPHDDVIKWKHFPRYWPFVRGIHRPPVKSPHKGQWRGALMFSLIYAWTDSWTNNGDAGDSIRYRAHYDFIAMRRQFICSCSDNQDRDGSRVQWYMHGATRRKLYHSSVFVSLPSLLSLYVLIFSEETKTYISILCHSSILIWHRVLKSFLE